MVDICFDFVIYSDTKAGTHKEEGWANSCYGTTKIGVTLMTPIQQKVMDEDNSRPDIVINCVCTVDTNVGPTLV